VMTTSFVRAMKIQDNHATLVFVNEFCTCGARLPEDARFCHKCGKPQREEDVVVESATPPQPPPLPAAAAAPAAQLPVIGFRNPAAVRAALISSALATLAGLVPLPSLIHTLWQLIAVIAGGFGSVYLYRRKTGEYLSVRGGLQIGWMVGMFCFVVMMVVLTLLLAFVSAVGEAGIKRLSEESGRPEVEQIFEMLANPAMLVLALVTSFFFLTVLGSAGGALGSKILERE
jgi:hypothetical protein